MKKIFVYKIIIFVTLLFPIVALSMFMFIKEKTFSDELLWMDFGKWFADVLFWLFVFAIAIFKFPEEYIEKYKIKLFRILVVAHLMYLFLILSFGLVLVSG